MSVSFSFTPIGTDVPEDLKVINMICLIYSDEEVNIRRRCLFFQSLQWLGIAMAWKEGIVTEASFDAYVAEHSDVIEPEDMEVTRDLLYRQYTFRAWR